MYAGDIVIYIDDDLDNDRIRDLEGQIGDEHGVYSACMHQKTRDLMVVDFDATEVRPSRIVESVRGGWLHAEMIGLYRVGRSRGYARRLVQHLVTRRPLRVAFSLGATASALVPDAQGTRKARDALLRQAPVNVRGQGRLVSSRLTHGFPSQCCRTPIRPGGVLADSVEKPSLPGWRDRSVQRVIE